MRKTRRLMKKSSRWQIERARQMVLEITDYWPTAEKFHESLLAVRKWDRAQGYSRCPTDYLPIFCIGEASLDYKDWYDWWVEGRIEEVEA